MSSPSTRLRDACYVLPDVPTPAGSYVPAVRSGHLVFTAGQLPLVNGELTQIGKVGENISVEEAAKCAQTCALNALAAAASEAGGLDNISRIVKVTGFVASEPGFNRQPEVINGASDFLGEIFGEAGRHARSAVGVSELPLDSPVEIEIVVELKNH